MCLSGKHFINFRVAGSGGIVWVVMPLCFDIFTTEIAGRDHRDVKPYHLAFHPPAILIGFCDGAVHKIGRPGNPAVRVNEHA